MRMTFEYHEIHQSKIQNMFSIDLVLDVAVLANLTP